MIITPFISLVNDLQSVMPRVYDAFKTILSNLIEAVKHINDHELRLITLELAKKKCEVYNNANISIPGTGALTVLPMNSEDFDNDEMHHLTTNNSRITFNTPGWYDVGCCVEIDNSGLAGTLIQVAIQLVATGFTGIIVSDRRTSVATGGFTGNDIININRIYKFAQGDYIEVYVSQNSGGAVPVLYANSRYTPRFWAHMIEELYNPDVIPGRYE